MFVALMFERSLIPLGMLRQNDIGAPNTWAATPARRKWTAADMPWGPAPMTATSRSGERPVPLLPTLAALDAFRGFWVITSSTNNSDTSLDCEIGQEGQLGEARTQIVGREHGLSVGHAQRAQIRPPVEPTPCHFDGRGGKVGREPDPGDPGSGCQP